MVLVATLVVVHNLAILNLHVLTIKTVINGSLLVTFDSNRKGVIK